MKVTLVILFLLFIIIIGFLRFCPSFGRTGSKEDRKDYEKRASNYKDGKFRNDGEFRLMSGRNNGEKNNVVSKSAIVPTSEVPVRAPKIEQSLDQAAVTVTWFGHSSILLQINGRNILMDPVFSKFASPVSFAGPKRFSEPPITVEALPKIDLVLLSHDHYDHLDYKTIRAIDHKVGAYLVPLGVEKHLERWKISKKKVKNLAWWEETSIYGLTIACTPTRHFSGRGLTDHFKSLWCSWVIKADSYQVFASGDGGYGTQFKEIRERYGTFDLALMECGQYDKAWPSVHMTPEQTYQAAEELEADVILPIHWCAYKLAKHPWDDPVERLLLAAGENETNIVTPRIGQTVDMNCYEKFRERWWRD
ncbi:MAG: MBL fold metallo-hydrolase [bacterium]|nr:MBL fold metallo-hydrolase [bacterium]